MKPVALAAALVLLAAGCGSSGTRGGSALPRPAGDYSATVDNAWFPLPVGATWVYRGAKDGKPARDVVTVKTGTKTIDGVPCAVVDDRLYLAGRLGERTTDWYSQDSDGNVWYFGEDTAELDRDGKVTSTEGTWQTGRDGAVPGIFMPAHPKVGASFRQEFYKGHAEDHFSVMALRVPTRVPYGSWNDAMRTREWTPLEPGAIDAKYYVRGIGTVKEQAKDGSERSVLVSFERG